MARKPALAATHVFGAAPVIAAPKAASKSNAVQKAVPGLEAFTALNAVITMLEGMRNDFEFKIKTQMIEEFVADGVKIERKPANFKGIEGFASASCQLRASSSNLSPETIELLKDTHGLEDTHFFVEQKITDALIFNPEYTRDPAFVAKLEKTLGREIVKLQDERGALIMKQEGVTKTTLNDDGRNAVFTKPEADIRAMLPLVFTTAITAKLETNGDLAPALKLVEKLMNPAEDDAAETAAA